MMREERETSFSFFFSLILPCMREIDSQNFLTHKPTRFWTTHDKHHSWYKFYVRLGHQTRFDTVLLVLSRFVMPMKGYFFDIDQSI